MKLIRFIEYSSLDIPQLAFAITFENGNRPFYYNTLNLDYTAEGYWNAYAKVADLDNPVVL